MDGEESALLIFIHFVQRSHNLNNGDKFKSFLHHVVLEKLLNTLLWKLLEMCVLLGDEVTWHPQSLVASILLWSKTFCRQATFTFAITLLTLKLYDRQQRKAVNESSFGNENSIKDLRGSFMTFSFEGESKELHFWAKAPLFTFARKDYDSFTFAQIWRSCRTCITTKHSFLFCKFQRQLEYDRVLRTFSCFVVKSKKKGSWTTSFSFEVVNIPAASFENKTTCGYSRSPFFVTKASRSLKRQEWWRTQVGQRWQDLCLWILLLSWSLQRDFISVLRN